MAGTMRAPRVGRRRLLARGAAAAITAGPLGGGVHGTGTMARAMRRSAATPTAAEGRLRARPGRPSETTSPGLHRLGLDERRDALLYVPAGYDPAQPAPLVLSLHGAGGNAEGSLYPLRDLADGAGLVILAAASRDRTWDAILGGFGPDAAWLDRALAEAFARCAVDPTRLAVAGFSDGASYALSLGLTNGDLFPQVLAFSPGFAAPGGPVGAPRCFVSHGTRDDVLPIERCSRRIVPALERAGYEVRYREFDGGHTVPPEIAQEAADWYLARPGGGTPTAG